MRTLRGWLLRLGGMFGKERRERELAQEMESHLQMHIEDNLRAGMSAAEARRNAFIKLGGIEQTKEIYRDRRGLPVLETFIQDLRFGVRMLQKNPGFSLIAVFTLALGIAANATIFSFVSAVILRKPTVSDPDRLMVVYGTNSTHEWGTYQNPVSAPNFFTWKNENRVFSDMAAANAFETANLTGQGEPERVSARGVTANYFSILGVSPALGRTFAAGEDQNGNDHVVVLSHELWERRYGSNPKLVGATVRLDGESHTVIGVMPASFLLPAFQAQLWRPLILNPAQQSAAARENRKLFLYGRLKPGVSTKQAQANIGTLGRLAAEAFPEAEKSWGAATLTLQEFTIQVFGFGPILVMLMCAVGFVLLISCANVAGLLLARATGRGKEMAIRVAIGAGRGRMIRQLLTEAGLIALLGGALGLALTFWGARVLQSGFSNYGAARTLQLRVDAHVLFFAAVISLLAAILFGLAPALRAGATDVHPILKNDSATVSASRERTRLRNVLVAGEVALAVFSLTGAGLMIKGIYDDLYANLRFDPQNLLTAQITLPDARYGNEAKQAAFFYEMLGKLRALPGAESAAVTSDLPGIGAGTRTFRLKGQEDTPAGERPRAQYYAVSSDYLHTADIPLIAGRGFTKEDGPNAPPVALVNARQFFPKGDVLGKQILIDTGNANEKLWREIVGVVPATCRCQLFQLPNSEIYEPFLQKPGVDAYVMLRANSNPDSLAPGLREAVWALDKDQPIVSVMSMQQRRSLELGGAPVIQTILGIFAGLALILAAVGLYGLVAYSVGQRSQEIGIRMTLGAGKEDVFRLVLGDGMKLALMGVAIGLVGAFPLPRAFGSLFPDFHIAGGWIFVLVSVVIGGVVVLACYIPARRAMRVDPMVALRYE
jgi:predicted permease